LLSIVLLCHRFLQRHQQLRLLLQQRSKLGLCRQQLQDACRTISSTQHCRQLLHELRWQCSTAAAW
jgi:hypothetical protein